MARRLIEVKMAGGDIVYAVVNSEKQEEIAEILNAIITKDGSVELIREVRVVKELYR